jgi:hypothetical protein
MSHPNDTYANVKPVLRLDDLPKRDDSLPTKLSLMISTCYRYSQLQRTLETLCRQDWKEFEVLICDDGDNEDLTPIFQQFEPYLRIKTTRREKTEFSVDPSGGFKTLFPIASGEYWAIMQPELMLYPEVCRLLYEGHIKEYPSDYLIYNPRGGKDDGIGGAASQNIISFQRIMGRDTWVTIKPYAFSPEMMPWLDKVDWHSDLEVLKTIPNFWHTHYGLSTAPNAYWDRFECFWFWFCASASKNAHIWEDMPEMKGHAQIDFYTIGYRQMYKYVDIIPRRARAFHQDHVRLAYPAPGETNNFKQFFVPKR